MYEIQSDMKTLSILLMGLLLSFSVSSCFGSDDDDSHHNDDDDNSNGGITEVVDGTWKVTFFQEDNSNQTSHFNGYVFDFGADGSVVATNGTITKTGLWNNGGDDSSNKLNIQFPDNNGPFEEISEDWDITEKTVTEIDLKHISGGDGSIDLLTFEKL